MTNAEKIQQIIDDFEKGVGWECTDFSEGRLIRRCTKGNVAIEFWYEGGMGLSNVALIIDCGTSYGYVYLTGAQKDSLNLATMGPKRLKEQTELLKKVKL